MFWTPPRNPQKTVNFMTRKLQKFDRERIPQVDFNNFFAIREKRRRTSNIGLPGSNEGISPRQGHSNFVRP